MTPILLLGYGQIVFNRKKEQYIYPNVALVCTVTQPSWWSGIVVTWEEMYYLLYQYTTVVDNYSDIKAYLF